MVSNLFALIIRDTYFQVPCIHFDTISGLITYFYSNRVARWLCFMRIYINSRLRYLSVCIYVCMRVFVMYAHISGSKYGSWRMRFGANRRKVRYLNVSTYFITPLSEQPGDNYFSVASTTVINNFSEWRNARLLSDIIVCYSTVCVCVFKTIANRNLQTDEERLSNCLELRFKLNNSCWFNDYRG